MKIDNYLLKTIAVDKDENLSIAMEKMEKNNIQDIPVTNEGEYIGKLSYLNLAEELGSIRKGNKPASQLHVATAYNQNGSLLSSKTSLKTAASELVSRNSSILLVKDKKIIGSLRAMDVLNEINLDEPAKEIINQNFTIIPSTERVVNARRRTIDRGKDVLVVKENQDILGILTPKEIAEGMNSFRRLVPAEKQDSRIRNLLVEDIMENNYLKMDKDNSIMDVSTNLYKEKEWLTLISDDFGGIKGFINQFDLLKKWCGDER